MKMAKELGYKYFFSVQEIIFSVMGIDITAKEKSVKYPFLLVFPIANLFVLMAACLAYCWDNHQDTDKLTDGLSHVMMMIVVIYKLGIYIGNQRQVQKLIHNICTLSRTDDEEERALISGLNKKVTYFSAAYLGSAYNTLCSGFILPLVLTAIIYSKTGELVLIIPIKANFYIDYSKPWVYFLLLLWIFVAIYIVSTATIAIETLYAWLVQNTKAQFQILNIRMKRAACLENDTDMNTAIIECIRFHQRIIELALDFNLIYRPIIFVQFAMSCLPLCFIGFQLTMGSGNTMYYAMYVTSMTFQIALYCVGGQIVQNESLNVSESIYASFPWERLSKKNKTMLLLTMLRAQKACNLTGIFFVVDMDLFVWVLRTSFSYVTILWTLDANSKKK